MIDSHNHTEYSYDCSMTLEEAIRAADEANLKLTITEHVDRNISWGSDYVSYDLDAWYHAYEPYRTAGKILLGVEIGMHPDTIEFNKMWSERVPFDQVIGSVHTFLDGFQICDDAPAYKGRAEQFFEDYLAYATELVTLYPWIDTFAHIDYPCRYSYSFVPKILRYEDHPQALDRFLIALIKNQTSLEINTKLLNQQDYYDALAMIASRYKALGGVTVTIGGDHHRPSVIGKHHAYGRQLIAQTGLTCVAYVGRKAVIDPQR